MPKISSVGANKTIAKYILKVIFSTAISILLLSVIFSFITLKLDLDLDYCKYFSIATVILTSLAVSSFSLLGFKNNLLFLSMLSVLPLLIFIIVNFIINPMNTAIVAIKILGVISCAFIMAIIKSRKK